ncbi:Similar to phosphoglycolate phosphatase, clustered with ubiquinone biosynthesis SAM-dependent O-methyltransferase [hydrothermal vent metagenome]|uniref:Similar to phosphoglycolate phosphatase, clustered with ubiquinone biosynthesis SAM-dependent O-methyltransferase n=1 Tax=hydrothermal vent metagenome TaxID=652676 RepID=A0A1W1CES1_9ZZZZ
MLYLIFMKFKVFLFDLDGTLVDTAQDLVFVLNQLLKENNIQELPFNIVKPYVSHGALAMINLGFGDLNEVEKQQKLQRFLELYQQNINYKSKLFFGMNVILEKIKTWGIVTNKSEKLTFLLLDKMNLKPSVVVCGDTLKKAKPHPDPLLYACNKLGVQPNDCIYIGDDKNDILAAKTAKMKSIAVSYGYGIDAQDWGADYVIKQPKDLEKWIF